MNVMTACLVMIAAGTACAAGFEDLGIPVRKAGFMGAIAGPDASGEDNLLYFNLNQEAAPLFIVQVNPDTGEAKQFNAPKGPGAWALIVGPDKKVYLGTWGGGFILRFDPANPEAGIEYVGKPSETESYIWQYALGADGRLYGCTYPQAKLVSYDPATGEMADLGRMDDTQMYTRFVAAGEDGIVYVGIGFAMANVVAYDPATGEHRSILPEEHKKQGMGQVMTGTDGQVYALVNGAWFRCKDMALEPIDNDQFPGNKQQILADGRILAATGNGTYGLVDPKTGERTDYTFEYEGAGSGIFVVGEGPGGKIYGSTAMPLSSCSCTIRRRGSRRTWATRRRSAARSTRWLSSTDCCTSARIRDRGCRCTIRRSPSRTGPIPTRTPAASAASATGTSGPGR